MQKLLIIAHMPSYNTQRLAEACLGGAQHPDFAANISVRLCPPLQTSAEDVLRADGVILGTPENFGYMSGALKDFFDRSYEMLLERKSGMPYALYIRAGRDGTGTSRSVTNITGAGLGWKLIQSPLILHGVWQETFIDQLAELGQLMAAGLEAGLF